MDINFIIFFIFLLIVIEYLSCLEDGMMLIILGFFIEAIFVNTQSSIPIFFANSAYLGWGQLFNSFWLVLGLICFIRSYFVAQEKGLFQRTGWLKGVK